jgi:hypothetical protein
MNWNDDSFPSSSHYEDAVTAVHETRASRVAEESRPGPDPKPVSHCDLDDLIGGLRVRNFILLGH